MGSDCSTCIMPSMGYMIVLVMLIASTWSKTTENSTQDVNVRSTCYTEADCGSYEICCEWECTNYDYGCDETYCSSYISCPYSWQICCAGICLNEDYGCHVTTNFAPSTTPSPSPTCAEDYSVCNWDQFCCEGECVGLTYDCYGEDALWGIGIAAVVASFVGPIVCCCCCCGCGLFFILSSRKKRRGQAQQPGVHMMQPQQMMQQQHMMQQQYMMQQQPGMQMMQGGQVQPQGFPTGGFVTPPVYGQENQAGGVYPSDQDPERKMSIGNISN